MKKLLILLPLLVLISCGVQKRKYQKGYYVNWNKSKTQHDKKEVVANSKTSGEKKAEPKTAIPPIVSQQQDDEPELEASVAKDMGSIKSKKTLIKRDEPCDQLIFKDGTEIQAKVLEISATEVRYKKCSMLDGPVYVGKKSDIFMIKYANGSKDVFKDAQNEPEGKRKETAKYTGPVKTHPLAIVALILGIIAIYPGFFYGAIVALIFANIAKKDILAKPEKYKGMGLANAAKVLAIIDICIAVALILALIMLFVILI